MVILDSSVWVGFLVKADSNHFSAIKELSGLSPDDLIVPDFVFIEVLTVLRNKKLDDAGNAFLAFVSGQKLKMLFGDEDILLLAVNLFIRFKKLSFVDCKIMAMAKLEKAELVTFDKALSSAWKAI